MRPSIVSISRLAATRSAASRPSSRLQSSLASSAYTDSTEHGESTSSTSASLTSAQRESLDQMLRIDHSGEIAANTIYTAQARMFALLGDQATSKMMLEMLETEKKHLKVAEKLLQQHRIRPSALAPMWGIAGTILGAATAVLGKKGAMAATEAVETVIGEHYDDQLKSLSTMTSSSDPSAPPHPSLPLLEKIIVEFRDDELEHLDTAVEHDAQQAPGHALLSAVIGYGCKGAIQIAKRI
ncbi:hypothetical protein CBS101457_003577 [Exobasidium rhododendri]|nr:hypothetical protein CBS101457_003577 [Exobasidium rhododendri]